MGHDPRRAQARTERRATLKRLLAVPFACVGVAHGAELGSNVSSAALEPTAPFILGITPHASARELFNRYQPLRQFLQEHLRREVRIVSAPNFDEFLFRALDGRYDLAITTGPQARLLQLDAGWLPLATYQAELRMVIFTAANNADVQRLEDLAGKRFIHMGISSITGAWSERLLKERGIVPGKIDALSASDSLAEWVASGAAAAGCISQAHMELLPEKLRGQLRIIERSEPLLGRVYVLNPRMISQSAKIRTLLDEFARSPAGVTYFQRSLGTGYRDITLTELESTEPFVQELRKTVAKYKLKAPSAAPASDGVIHAPR